MFYMSDQCSSKNGTTSLPNRTTAYFALFFIFMYANYLAMSFATAVVLGVPSLIYSYIYDKPLPNDRSLVMHYSPKV